MTDTENYEEFCENLLRELRLGRIECAGRTGLRGQRFAVPREGADPVDVLLYRPAAAAKKPLPVLFNMHGGTWVGNDAVLMDSFCALLADEIPAFVVNVNYKKADIHPFPYAIEEVRDAVLYFAAHAEEYGLDEARFAVGGHSAGGQLAAGAALLLRDMGFRLACQMLVYPVTDMIDSVLDEDRAYPLAAKLLFPNGGMDSLYASPRLAPVEKLAGAAPALFIECGRDSLRAQGLAYAKELMDAAVPVKVKEYPAALHGFIEVNRAEYSPVPELQTPEQAALCRDAERWLIRELRASFEL